MDLDEASDRSVQARRESASAHLQPARGEPGRAYGYGTDVAETSLAMGWRIGALGLPEEVRLVAGRLLILLVALYINRKLAQHAPLIWGLVPLSLCVALSRARLGESEKPIVRFWQFVALLSAFYSLLHYPLMPPVRETPGILMLYGALLVAWVGATISGVLCLRFRYLSILPPAFLFWGNILAERVTGLRIVTHIDVQPLTEVSVCIGLALLINHAYRRRSGRASVPDRDISADRTLKLSNDTFIQLAILLAVGVHLANYFWSFYAKMMLDGPWGSWLVHNNPVGIFLAALDNDHILFSGYPQIVQWAYTLFDTLHHYSNFWILAVQGAAIAAFFMPKRAFLALLLMYDAMHTAIILIVGANFWPWIILNVIVVAVVSSRDYRPRSVWLRAIASGFILIAPHFVQVTELGWYDSTANNKLFLEAIDDTGRRYTVPTNFFTFYSYSIGHMDDLEFGIPDPEHAFDLLTPNGGSPYFRQLVASRRCDIAALTRSSTPTGRSEREQFSTFIRNYHRLALKIYATIGTFPYDVYPHHFYIPPSESEDFRRLDKRRIVAYVMRRESVCLAFDAGELNRNVISSAEYRIDVDPIEHGAPGGRP